MARISSTTGGRYARTLANQRTVTDDLRELGRDEDEEDFRIFYGRFYERVAEELKWTDARLAEYRRLAS